MKPDGCIAFKHLVSFILFADSSVSSAMALVVLTLGDAETCLHGRVGDVDPKFYIWALHDEVLTAVVAGGPDATYNALLCPWFVFAYQRVQKLSSDLDNVSRIIVS